MENETSMGRRHPASRGRVRHVVAVAAVATAFGASCVRTRTEIVQSLAPPARGASGIAEPPPARRADTGSTAVAMQGVDFHVAPAVVLHVRALRGELSSVRPGAPVDFDDLPSLVLEVATADAGITTADLGRLLNQYVFAYPDAPLIDLRVSAAGSALRLRGRLRKGGDIPFEILAAISATPAGEILVHPTAIRVAQVPAGPLLGLTGLTLERLIDLRGARGARAHGNDLYLDPERLTPPPQLRGHLSAARVDGDEVRLAFTDRGRAAPPTLYPPEPTGNWVYLRHGTVQIGRLLMADADLEIADARASDPFDFSLADYWRQLVASSVRVTPSGGLVVHAPDLGSLDRVGDARVVTPVRTPR